jgi:PTS system nitrogen regulatory IIA component
VVAKEEHATGMTPQTFLSYFSEKRFVRELRARSKEGALRELTELLGREREVHDPHLLLEMLKRRETLGSTGIGHGVAIPHGRTLATSKLKVAFARSTRGIPFDAIDGKPVHLIFLIVAPYHDPKNEYLPLLGKIVEAVKSARVRRALLKVETFEDLKSVLTETITDGETG